MATIGVYDWDLLRWRSPIVFNLELMKIAYYNKVYLKNYVKMPTRDFDIDQFRYFYVRKDYADLDTFAEWSMDSRIIIGGLAISNGIHVPLPENIETCPSDTQIYDKARPIYNWPKNIEKLYDKMLKGQHLRLISGNGLLKNWERQIELKKKTRNIFIHDKDLVFSQDVKTALMKIKYTTFGEEASIGMKFPVDIYHPDDYTFWVSFRKIKELNTLNVHCELEDKNVGISIKNPQTINFILSDNFFDKDTFKQKLYKILLQTHYLAERRFDVQILYSKMAKIPQLWKDFILFYNNYLINVKRRSYKIFFNAFKYCKFLYEIPRQEKINLFSAIKKESSLIFNLMYDMEYTKYENGCIKPHMYTPFEIEKKGGYYDKTGNFSENHDEQFNYASITEPKRVYIEQHYIGSARGESKLTVDLW